MLTEQLISPKTLMIISMVTVFVLVLVIVLPFGYALFSRLGIMSPRSGSSTKILRNEEPETPMELLTELYQSGKITKKEFDDVKKDLELYVVGKKSKNEFETVKHNLEHYIEEVKHPDS